MWLTTSAPLFASGESMVWSGGASIPGPTAFQAVALPTELPDPRR